MTLSEFIQDYLNEHQLSHRQFARICGLSNGYISMIIRNVDPRSGKPVVPSIKAMMSIAQGMGIEIDDLFATIDDMEVDISDKATNSLKMLEYYNLTKNEKQLILAYRKHPEMQNAINTLLGIKEDK